jgi:hypothetical protein
MFEGRAAATGMVVVFEPVESGAFVLLAVELSGGGLGLGMHPLFFAVGVTSLLYLSFRACSYGQ